MSAQLDRKCRADAFQPGARKVYRVRSVCHIRERMRNGRYKKNFLLPEQCPAFASAMLPVAERLQRQWETQNISAPELVAEFLLAGIQFIRPQTWKGSRIKPGTPKTTLETLEIFSLRGIPLSAQTALSQWAKGQYPLRLFLSVPSTDEILALQNTGIRCVTVVLDHASLSQYVLKERDPFSFVLHDLIHADHFFHNPLQTRVQIGFSRWLSEMWLQKELQNQLLASPTFAAQFEYACADMNSHGAHLVKYLKAIFCQHRQLDLLLCLAQRCRLSTPFQQALVALNTVTENATHLQTLEIEFLQKGSGVNPTLSFLNDRL